MAVVPHLLHINVIQFLHCIPNLMFVGSHVNHENQSVVVFDFLHRRLSCERMLDNSESVQFVASWC